MIEVHDNLLEPHIAELISDYMKDLQWKFYYHSDKEIPSYHWHIFCGHNESEAKMNGFEMFLPIWQAAQYKLKLKEIPNKIKITPALEKVNKLAIHLPKKAPPIIHTPTYHPIPTN